MKTQPLTLAALLALACLAAPAAQADVRLDSGRHHHTGVRLDGDDVLIRAQDRSEARVTPAGDLYIGDRQVGVTAPQRKLLVQYNAGIHDIEHRGLEIGRSAITLVGGIIGPLVTAALAGEDDDEIEARARASAEPLKQQGRELCKVAKAEYRLQEEIAEQLPAFRPYTVMDDDSDDDCNIDDDEV